MICVFEEVLGSDVWTQTRSVLPAVCSTDRKTVIWAVSATPFSNDESPEVSWRLYVYVPGTSRLIASKTKYAAGASVLRTLLTPGHISPV